MTPTTRRSSLAIPALVTAVLGVLGCSSSNNPSLTAGTGGASSETTGGSVSTAGNASTSAGGSTGTGAATGGSATSGSTGGSTGAFQPPCSSLGNTAAGVAVAKGGACVASDPQMCYKTCGPQSIGFKSETCTAGVYVEQSGCSFPTGVDYSCYKIPATQDPSCPTTTPQASQACSVATCTLCADANGQYLDSSGAAKTGWCVCPASSSGSSKWSCASSTAWPCPAGQGC